MKKTDFLPAFLFLLIAWAMVWVTSMEEKPNFYPTLIGKEIPKFETKTLYNNSILKSEDLKDNVILNFWASWCTGCKFEHEALLDLQKQGYKIYGIDTADKNIKAKRYLEESGNPYVKNGVDPTRAIAVAFGITGTPETFIIGKDGKIYYHFRGPLTEPEIETKLKPILAELEEGEDKSE